MNVLIIGFCGREHALAWKVAQEDSVSQVFVASGNAGTELEEKVSNVQFDVVDQDNTEELIAFAKEEMIGLTIVGPEAPLALGIVDAFNEAGLKCFGPTQDAAQLESSKAFAKDFLAKYKIPTANYQTFTDPVAACEYISRQGAPIVVKADGLAAGKGVVVANSIDEAQTAAREMLIDNKFGDAGARVVVEEFLQGEEASFICIVADEQILPLATSQDHKARDNGDKGPNTGGMGAYSPAPVITSEMHQCIMQQVIRPTVQGMKSDGYPYTGFLYAGIMVMADGTPKVLEYNCRFGDPETQPIMMRLKSNLADLCLAALDGKLDEMSVEWDQRAALGVVLAAGGYPENYNKGDVISGLDNIDSDSVRVFHAGTALNENNQVVTAGGRVLCVTALGETVTDAQHAAYTAIKKISWDGMFCRTDIGYRAIARETV